jgi:hypothetical protein
MPYAAIPDPRGHLGGLACGSYYTLHREEVVIPNPLFFDIMASCPRMSSNVAMRVRT